MDIKDILLIHFKKYPKMQIQDMVKLIYQNEFAGGHMIKDENASLEYLKEELNSSLSSAANIFEDIGNGLLRLNLAPVKNTSIEPETINRMFVNSANSVKGSIQSFEEKLEILKDCCRNLFPYSIKELEEYLKEYKDRGYPPVSHSNVYRKEYMPSYRIVKSVYRDFFELFLKIDSLAKRKDTVLIAIDGNCGSGKTSLAAFIKRVYDCNVFHMDDFFLKPELKTKERLNEPGGNVDYVRFKEEVMDGLLSGESFKYRKYDCQTMTLGEWINVDKKKINIIEGSYSMHPTLVESYDLKVFLYVDEEIQLDRILKRNGPVKLKRFINEWIPLENKYFEALKIKDKCDLVYDMSSNPLGVINQ